MRAYGKYVIVEYLLLLIIFAATHEDLRIEECGRRINHYIRVGDKARVTTRIDRLRHEFEI